MGFVMLLVSNAVSVIPRREKTLVFTGMILLVFFNLSVFMYFGNAQKANYTIGRFQNFLLP